jgi:lauroyl/myristoyl acyltransferase
MASHERVIRRHPDQWYMFRRMWQQRAAGWLDAPGDG